MSGRKVWAANDVLAAADLNGYLMDQAVQVFADSAARDAALPTPTAGMVTYRTNGTVIEFYNGSAWTGLTAGSLNAQAITNTLTTSTATAYTFGTADQGTTVLFTSASAVTATVSTATALTAGQRIEVLRDGAGTVTIAAGSGVTFAGRGTAGTAYTMPQYDAATIYCTGSNTYRIIGNLTVA